MASNGAEDDARNVLSLFPNPSPGISSEARRDFLSGVGRRFAQFPFGVSPSSLLRAALSSRGPTNFECLSRSASICLCPLQELYLGDDLCEELDIDLAFPPAETEMLSSAGEAYDARDRGPNRKSRFKLPSIFDNDGSSHEGVLL